jgi:hypothetical protein
MELSTNPPSENRPELDRSGGKCNLDKSRLQIDGGGQTRGCSKGGKVDVQYTMGKCTYTGTRSVTEMQKRGPTSVAAESNPLILLVTV